VTKTAAQALAWAKTQKSGYSGMCLQFVRTAFGVPAKYVSAIAAWNNAKAKHATTNVAEIPVGAPIFFGGSTYGHVAIYAGNGLMVTTNSGLGRPTTQAVALWQGWGYKLLGWSEDINGVKVISKPTPKPVAAGAKLVVDGYLGPKTITAWQKATRQTQTAKLTPTFVKAWQRILKDRALYTGAIDGILGPHTIRGTQRYLGTPVDGVISSPSKMVKALQTRLNAGTI